MAQREPKDPTTGSGPPTVASGPQAVQPAFLNQDFFLQFAIRTERSIGELKTALEGLTRSIGALSERLDRLSERMDKVEEAVHTARGTFSAVLWIAGVIGTLILLVLSTGVTILLKHFKLI